MAKKVTGYLTSDEAFYVHSEDARLHEARIQLEARLLHLRTRPDAVFDLIDQALSEFEEYISAKKSIEVGYSQPEVTEPEPSEVSEGSADDD